MSGNLQFRRGLKTNLPTSAPVGMPLWCTDTKELYIGNGDSVIKPDFQASAVSNNDIYSIIGQSYAKSANGYFKIPVAENSFLIFQWGTVSGMGFGTSKNIYFPIAFPSTCAAIAISASYYQGAGNKGSSAKVSRTDATKFNITSRFEQSSASIDWIAIGW